MFNIISSIKELLKLLLLEIVIPFCGKMKGALKVIKTSIGKKTIN